MKCFIAGEDRHQATLLRDCLDDHVNLLREGRQPVDLKEAEDRA